MEIWNITFSYQTLHKKSFAIQDPKTWEMFSFFAPKHKVSEHFPNNDFIQSGDMRGEKKSFIQSRCFCFAHNKLFDLQMKFVWFRQRSRKFRGCLRCFCVVKRSRAFCFRLQGKSCFIFLAALVLCVSSVSWNFLISDCSPGGFWFLFCHKKD